MMLFNNLFKFQQLTMNKALKNIQNFTSKKDQEAGIINIQFLTSSVVFCLNAGKKDI